MEALISSIMASGPEAKRLPHILLPLIWCSWSLNLMTTENTPSKKPFGKLLAGAAIVAIAGGLYAFFSGPDNPKEAQTCPDAGKTIAAITPFTKGQLRSFRPLDDAIDLTAITFLDGKDKKLTLADWKGRTVLLNLWATWCAPCRREMPALDRLQHDLGGDKFEVVPVSVDRGDGAKPRAFYEKTGLKDLALYTDSSGEIFDILRKHGLVLGLPTTILIDKQGCAVGALKGPAEWDADEAKKLIRAAM
jgi:thiol-disulfide isomerase/thioredoxin